MKKLSMQMKVVSSVLTAALVASCPAMSTIAGVQPVMASATINNNSQLAPIQWESSFATAQKMAKASGKLIMIDFFTDWCGWCKVLDEETYTDSRVKILSTEFVALKLDAENAGASLAQKFGVAAYPTIMFVDSKGTIVKKVEGYQDGRVFTSTLAQLLQTRSGAQLTKAAQSKPEDVALQARLAIINASQGKIAEAKPFLQKVQTADAQNQTGTLSAIYQAIAGYYFSTRDYTSGIDYLVSQIKVSHNVKETIFAQLMLSVSYLSTKQKTKAIESAKAVLNTPQATEEEKKMASELLAAANQ